MERPTVEVGVIHLHSSHKLFCGSDKPLREWSPDTTKVTCTNCLKNLKFKREDWRTATKYGPKGSNY